VQRDFVTACSPISVKKRFARFCQQRIYEQYREWNKVWDIWTDDVKCWMRFMSGEIFSSNSRIAAEEQLKASAFPGEPGIEVREFIEGSSEDQRDGCKEH
jgi:hypothetical protein